MSSCSFKKCRSSIKELQWSLKERNKFIVLEITEHSSHSSSINRNSLRYLILFVLGVCDIYVECQHSADEANKAHNLWSARTMQRTKDGNEMLSIAQTSEQIWWCILSKMQVLPYCELCRGKIMMIESYNQRSEGLLQ